MCVDNIFVHKINRKWDTFLLYRKDLKKHNILKPFGIPFGVYKLENKLQA